MHITRLEIRNCLGIKELQLNPGQINLISGDNERGKTSLLETIEKGLLNAQRRPVFVRHGADEATLFVELSDGTTIDRRIAADGTAKVDVCQDGAKVKKPETVLRQLIGETGTLGFNPIDFLAKKDKEQTEILLSLIPMRVTSEDMQEWFGERPPVNLNQHALDVLTYLAETYFYDKRTVANAAVSDCQDEIGSLRRQLPDNYDGDEWRKVNIGELWKKVQDAQQVNGYREQAQQIIEGYSAAREAIKNQSLLKLREHEKHAADREQKVFDEIDQEKERISRALAAAKDGGVGEKDAIRTEICELQDQIRRLQQQILLKEQVLASVDEKTGIRVEALERELAGVNARFAPRLQGITEERDSKIAAIEEQEMGAILNLDMRTKRAQDYLSDQPAIDISPLQKAAENAERMKGFIGLFDNFRGLVDVYKHKAETARHLDQCVKIARTKPAELLKEIKLPVEGMGINEQMQITIDEMPIRNLSTSRQIRLAVDIARATSGPLKMICIDRFESLSPTRQKLFFDEIKGDGYQYFICVVGDGNLGIRGLV